MVCMTLKAFPMCNVHTTCAVQLKNIQICYGKNLKDKKWTIGCLHKQTVKLKLCWSSFLFNYSIYPFGVRIHQHGISWFGYICPLFLVKVLQLSDCEVISCAKLLLKENISYLDLDIFLGSLEVKFLFIFSFQADDWRFWAKSDWYLVFIIPSTSTKAPVPPVPADKNQLQSMILPPPWLTMGMVTCFWESLAFFIYVFCKLCLGLDVSLCQRRLPSWSPAP